MGIGNALRHGGVRVQFEQRPDKVCRYYLIEKHFRLLKQQRQKL